MTHGSVESQRRSKARQRAKRDHFWTDLAGLKHQKEPLTEDEAARAVESIRELTGRRYMAYRCSWLRCESWHIRPFKVRRRIDLARPA